MKKLLWFAWKEFSSARLAGIIAVISVLIAVSSSVFFYALSTGARQATLAKLEQSLAFNEIEVTPKFGVTLFRVTKEELVPLSDDVRTRLLALPEVELVFPEIQVGMLSSMEIDLFNTRFETDVPVFGVETASVEEKYDPVFTFDEENLLDPVPVLVSSGLVDLYNSGFADAIGKPKLNEEILVGQEFVIRLGYSSFFRTSGEAMRTVRAKIVGYSDRVPLIGVTMPIEYVQRFNEYLTEEDDVPSYSQLLVRVRNSEDVPKVLETIRSWDFNATSLFDKIAGVNENLNYLMYVLGIISVVIIAVSALNVFTTLYSMVMEKTKIIGTLRALGATRGQILAIYVMESACIGIFGGVLGTTLGAGAAYVLNVIVLQSLPFFASIGVDIIYLGPEVLMFGVVGSVLFTIVSGLYPAIHASRLSPKVALQH